MKLDQFSFELDYVEDEFFINLTMTSTGCSRAEAIKEDYRVNWLWKNAHFNDETRCVCALFERFFGYIKTKDCQKIIVRCVSEVAREKVMKLLMCYEQQVAFDYSSYQKLSVMNRKRMILEALMTAAKAVASAQNWDLQQFENAYDKVIECNYVNEWYAHENIVNPMKTHKADLLMQHHPRSMDISIVIKDMHNNEVYRELIISERPDENLYERHLGDLVWRSDDEVALVNQAKDNYWSIKLS